MKRIINGKTYNTDTATLVARSWWNDWRRDVDMEGTLYVTRGGAFFAVSTERDNEDARYIFEPLSREEADKWVESGEVEVFDTAIFGEPEEAAAEREPEATIYLRVPRRLKERIEGAARREDVSVNTYVMRCVESVGERVALNETATLMEAFTYFDGARGRNPRWSWSARSEDGKTVALAIWDFNITRDGDKVRADVRMDGARPRLGNRERIENLIWARDHCDGLFRVVAVTAKDRDARPRSIAKCEPLPDLVMRLFELDEETGSFHAESVAV